MLELLADISPAAYPLLAVLAYAAMLYPLGIILPCSQCCGCSQCAEGQLPETVTITLDNLPDRSQGPPLVRVDFTSCTGFGGRVIVKQPGGEPGTDDGPIAEVEVTLPGSGYAVLGREEPVLAADGNGEFTITLAETTDDCDLPAWEVTAVAVVDGGTGYADDTPLGLSVVGPGQIISFADARVRTIRTIPAPYVMLFGPGDISLTVEQVSSSPVLYSIDSATVNDGGSGYSDQQALLVLVDAPDSEESPASLVARTVRAEPTIAHDGVADISLTFTSLGGTPETWEITGASVVDGGTGYNDDTLLSLSLGAGDTVVTAAEIRITADGNGTITSLAIEEAGEYFNDTGVIESVEIANPGQYYGDTGVVESVEVLDGGLYYAENAALPALVPDITGTFTQTPPSDGSDGEITPVVDDDPDSPTFGRIIGATIADAGSDYLAWEWVYNLGCGEYYNGQTIVLRRLQSSLTVGTNPNYKCFFEHQFCGVGNTWPQLRGRLLYEYRGPSTPGLITLESAGQYESVDSGLFGSTICNTVFTLDENVTDCGDIDTTATAPSGATATIVGGGEYDPDYRRPGGLSCSTCCRGDEESVEEITATIVNLYPAPPAGRGDLVSGDYVFTQMTTSLASLTFGSHVPSRVAWRDPTFTMVAYIEPCVPQSITQWLAGACDSDYWKECRLIVRVAPAFGQTPNNFTGGVLNADACDLCGATPQCYPTGSQTLEDDILQVQAYTVTWQ